MVLNSLLGDSLRKDNRLVASYIRTQKSVSGFDMVIKAEGISISCLTRMISSLTFITKN